MTSTDYPGHTTTTAQYPETLEDYAVDDTAPPPRPRRRIPIVTALLAIALVAAAGFFAGVRVEKGRAVSTTSASSASAARSAGGAGRIGGSSTAGAGGVGGGQGGRGRTIGQVTAVEGGSLLITDATGNTIKVSTSPSSRITKTATANLSDIHPGDTVVITGTTQPDGTTAATAITIGGAPGGGGGFGGFGGGGGASGGNG
jgi:hypothetical protein